MSLSTRLVALSLIVAAAGSARAQSSVQADTTMPASVAAPIVSVESPRVSNDNAASDTASITAAVATTGAPLTGLRAGVHANESARALKPNAAATHANLGQARAMMVVGVAGLIAGAIIGGTPGTVIMVGGAVVGLFGLYDYLQ